MPLPYPDLSKSDPPKRKDVLVPDPQEYDMSDPDGIEVIRRSVKGRLDLFDHLVKGKAAK